MSGYLTAMEISSAGMTVERLRLDTAALNIANANSIRDAVGSLYQPLRVFARVQAPSFDSIYGGTKVPLVTAESLPTADPPRRIHDPGNPLADSAGFVEQPSVDPVIEMTQIMTAVRGYEADVRAMNAARVMAMRALEIGANS